MVHDVNIPPVESVDCLYAVEASASAFVVVAVGGGGGCVWGAIDLGSLGQKGEMKAQSRQTLVIGKEYLIERKREGKIKEKEEKFPLEQ